MLCGIDEAGRGPLAGDLVMAGCILSSHIEGLNDSKKLSEKKRESLYELIIKDSQYHIVKFSAQDIDTHGISTCLRRGLEEIMRNLAPQGHLSLRSGTCVRYLFDGNTTFGVKGLETMVKADATVPEVSAASILAKVTHDRDIVTMSKIYPQYEFEKHKGYGTARHVELIKKYGYCEIHRKSYKLKALEATLF